MHSKLYNLIKLGLFSVLILFSCKKESTIDSAFGSPSNLTKYILVYPNYFPKLDMQGADLLTIEGISLGRKLYYDTILSNNGKSCSSCHNSSESFSLYSVNSLPHVNLAWNSNYLWNGKVNGTLDEMMLFEVDEFFHTDANKLNNSPFYRAAFKKVYGTEIINSTHIAKALAEFFTVMISSNSKCDKFLQRTANLNNSEMNGFNIFTTEKGDCFHCHSLGLFTDNKFHNIGLDSEFTSINMGRYNVTFKQADIGLFKTPTLRNIQLTAPYMHDGRYLTLEQVVEHYNSGVKQSNTLDPIMTKPSKIYGLGLTPTEKQDLVAFLKTLTDTTFTKNPLLQQP